MNRYPLWKYLLIAFTIVVAAVYSLPNLSVKRLLYRYRPTDKPSLSMSKPSLKCLLRCKAQVFRLTVCSLSITR